MNKEEKDLIKEITELKWKIEMVVNKINVLAETSTEFEEIDKAFKVIEKAYRGLPDSKPDYKSDRQT